MERKGEEMGNMSNTPKEELRQLLEQATPDQIYILLGFARNIVKQKE